MQNQPQNPLEKNTQTLSYNFHFCFIFIYLLNYSLIYKSVTSMLQGGPLQIMTSPRIAVMAQVVVQFGEPLSPHQ